MADTANAFSATAELRAHRRTFASFGRLVLFAVLHIGLTLACLALAFLAHVPLIALTIWIAGTLAMITLLTAMASAAAER
jgi:hypothetical protein